VLVRAHVRKAEGPSLSRFDLILVLGTNRAVGIGLILDHGTTSALRCPHNFTYNNPSPGLPCIRTCGPEARTLWVL